MQTPKKFSSFSDQVSWISDEKGIKNKRQRICGRDVTPNRIFSSYGRI